MYIALYISSHGFGHMTRCLGIMQNILNTSDYNLYIVCGKRQNDFARTYLAKYKDRIIYKLISASKSSTSTTWNARDLYRKEKCLMGVTQV